MVLGKDAAEFLEAIGVIVVPVATLPEPVHIQGVAHTATVSQANLSGKDTDIKHHSHWLKIVIMIDKIQI